ncbi:hypothetical protein SAMN05192553_10179 [Cyclobacterium xiamenense]|uniref:Uncharacterized protein n=1 Tax=Cyclobacterium xiamenense TaxID=1297121 RepID=A0A1H6T2U6_9BACT|nr:hypothetical protein [Cyclobacterium xiamenense]SEI74433.1 hypothetical protein SAMN05192553_10179 [Cyclobacterium xiamenense]
MKTAINTYSKTDTGILLAKNILKLSIAGFFIGSFHAQDAWVGVILALYLAYSLVKKFRIHAEDRYVFLTGSLLGGLLGVCCEAWGIYYGHWEYHDLGGRTFPYWLPFAWSLAFTFVYQLEKDLFASLRMERTRDKVILTLLVALIFPTYGEIITIQMGVWTYAWPYQFFGVPLLAIFLLVVFHTGVNYLMVQICRRMGWQNEVFHPA